MGKAGTALWMVGGLVVAGILMGVCSGEPGEPEDDPPPQEVEAEVDLRGKVNFVEVVNPATVRVGAEVTNRGEEAVTPACEVSVEDAGGNYRGFDIFTLNEPVRPGGTQVFAGTLTVTNEGAAFVTEHEIECEAD